MTQINGLLTQKPDSPAPVAGNTQRFSWEQRTGKSGKPWIKIKNEGKDYGSACEIVEAEKTDFQDQHGNVSFNVSFIPSDDAGAVGGGAEKAVAVAAPATSDERETQYDRPIAVKIAGRILAYEVSKRTEAPLTVPDLADRLSSLTEAFLPVVAGAADPKAPDTEAKRDDDIPFGPSVI